MDTQRADKLKPHIGLPMVSVLLSFCQKVHFALTQGVSCSRVIKRAALTFSPPNERICVIGGCYCKNWCGGDDDGQTASAATLCQWHS